MMSFVTSPPLTDLLERLVVAGVAITARALAEAAPGFDLTLPQWRVLLVVGERSEGATVSVVATRMGVTLPATSRQLRRLAQRGLLTLAPDAHDRRAVRVRLTPEGSAVRDRILGYRQRQISAAAAHVRLLPGTLDDLRRVVAAFDDFR